MPSDNPDQKGRRLGETRTAETIESMSGTAFPPTIEVLGMNLGSHHTLVGESGGRSAIYSVKESAIAPGLLQVETEHGVLLLDPLKSYLVIDDAE